MVCWRVGIYCPVSLVHTPHQMPWFSRVLHLSPGPFELPVRIFPFPGSRLPRGTGTRKVRSVVVAFPFHSPAHMQGSASLRSVRDDRGGRSLFLRNFSFFLPSPPSSRLRSYGVCFYRGFFQQDCTSGFLFHTPLLPSRSPSPWVSCPLVPHSTVDTQGSQPLQCR